MNTVKTVNSLGKFQSTEVQKWFKNGHALGFFRKVYKLFSSKDPKKSKQISFLEAILEVASSAELKIPNEIKLLTKKNIVDFFRQTKGASNKWDFLEKLGIIDSKTRKQHDPSAIDYSGSVALVIAQYSETSKKDLPQIFEGIERQLLFPYATGENIPSRSVLDLADKDMFAALRWQVREAIRWVYFVGNDWIDNDGQWTKGNHWSGRGEEREQLLNHFLYVITHGDIRGNIDKFCPRLEYRIQAGDKDKIFRLFDFWKLLYTKSATRESVRKALKGKNSVLTISSLQFNVKASVGYIEKDQPSEVGFRPVDIYKAANLEHDNT